MMNNNVSSAIFTLEQEVLKTLLEGSLKPVDIASHLGLDAIPKRPDGRRTNTSNKVITGIPFGLEQKGFVKQPQPYDPWELTKLGRQRIMSN